MKYSKTALKELTREYKNVLKKCFLMNLGLIAFAGTAQAIVIDGDTQINGEELFYNEPVTIVSGNIGMVNAGLYSDDKTTVSGGTFNMDNSELSGHNGLEINDGTFTLSHDSEFAGRPNLTINGGTFTFNASHILSRTDGPQKGSISITDGDITFNKGSLSAYNYSDGGESGDHISEGGEINISGDTKITFNGGNSIDDPVFWVDDYTDPAEGRVIANQILAENINLSDNAEITVAKNANLKTTQKMYTDGYEIDFDIPASNIILSDNSVLNVSGGLRANVTGEENSNGTLNLNDGYFWIIGDVSHVNINVDGDIGYGVDGSIDNVTVNDGFSLLVKTTTAQYDKEDPEELDDPISNGVDFRVGTLTSEKDSMIEVSGNGHHSADILVWTKADLSGQIILENGGIEGEDEDLLATITLQDSDVNMTGCANIEAAGSIKIKDSTVETNTDEHGFVSSSDLTIDNSDIVLNGQTHVVAYNGVNEHGVETSGKLEIKNGSDITLEGDHILAGDTVTFDDSNLTVKGIGYITSEEQVISFENTGKDENYGKLEIAKGASLSVLSGKSMADIDDLGYPTIIEAYQALSPEVGTLQMASGTELNISGTLNANVDVQGGNVVVGSEGELISLGQNGVNLSDGSITVEKEGSITSGVGGINISGGNLLVKEDGEILSQSKDINITGGHITLKDDAQLMSYKNINISGGEIILDNTAEIWSTNQGFKTTVSGDAVITLTNDAGISPSDTLEIKGGQITATESEVASMKSFDMTGGTLNLNNSVFGTEGEYSNGKVTISGGTINVNPVEGTQSVVTEMWDYKSNVLLGEDVTMSSGEMNVAKGAILALRDGFDDDDEFVGVSTLDLTGGQINLSGTIDGNVKAGETAGTLSIEDSSAQIKGDIEGVNLTINENFNSANFKGMATGLGDVTLANGKTFTLNITEDLTDGEENLIVDSFSMGEGSTLNLTSNMEFEDGDPDLKVTKGISITGGILNLNGAGLKVEDDSVGSFKMEDAIVSQNAAGIVDRFVDTDMIISNSTITMANESYTEKDAIGDMIIRDSTITLNNEAELGKYQEGTLYIDNSDVNMTGDAFIYVDRGFLNIENESTVQMNGTASIEFDEDNLSDQNIVNVTNDATVVANGQNQILADAVDVTNNGTVRIAKGATLTVYDSNKHPDEDRGGRGGLNLNTADAVLDLSGTISADVGTNGEEAGTIVINDSSAAVQGDIDAVNLTVNKDWTLTSSDEYEVKSLGDVTANANLTLNLPLERKLVDSDDYFDSYQGKLDIGNISIADGSTLKLYSNLGTDHYGKKYDEEKEKWIVDETHIFADSLTLDENSQLNLKDVVLKVGLTDVFLDSDNLEDAVENKKVKVDLDNAALYSSDTTFTDSEITASKGLFSNYTLALNNTTVNAVNSEIWARELKLENKTNLLMKNGAIIVEKDDNKELFIDNATLNATDNTSIEAVSINVKNGGVLTLSNSTALFRNNMSVEDASINLADSLLGHVEYGNKDQEGNNFTCDLNGKALILDGGVVNVSGETTFLASEVSVGNQLNVLEGATLTTATTGAQKPIEDDESYDYEAGSEKANITVAETGQITNDGTIDNDITNGGVIVNNSVINGDLTNNGVYTGLISGVSGEFDNTNGTVNTWGDLDTDINGITNLTDVSALTKNVTMGTVNVRKSLDLDNNMLTADSVHVADNSLVSFRVSDKGTYGHIEADTISVSTIGTTLKLTVDAGILDKGDWMEAKVLSTTALTGSFATLSSNALYKFEDLGSGLFKITNTESAPDVIIDAGGTEDDKKVAEAWLDGDDFEEGTPAANVAEHLNDLAQNNPEAFKDAVEALKPDPAPTGHATANAVNNQIAGAVGGRLGGGQAPRGRAPAVAQRGPGMQPNNRPSNSRPAGNYVGRGRGRSGGDVYNNYVNAGLWAQGLYNKSKLDASSGFDGKTYGLSMGLDGEIFKGMKLGLGYAYTTSDIDATGRTTDVNTHTAILYGEKTFGNAFVNAVATYGFSKYEENKNVSGLKVKAKYDMDSIFGQGMAGYNMLFKNGTITPEAGIRYLWTKTHAYTDTAGQQVKASKTDTLTGVVGARAGMNTKIIGFDEIIFHPEISLRATYDIVDADNKSVVQLANGSSYTTNGKSLDRFGVEAGAGIGMRYDNIECSLNYEGKFKKNYSDHTGVVNLRYNF